MNNFNLKIITNGCVLKNKKIKNNEFNVDIEDTSSYSISFENNKNIIADVYLKIDGKKMGCYRLIPNEKYEISRPIRRKKELIFLSKENTNLDKGLYNDKNKELGIIEADFKTGIINLKHKEFTSNKVFRPEREGYIPEYMNIYKKKDKYSLFKKDDEDYMFENLSDLALPPELGCEYYNENEESPPSRRGKRGHAPSCDVKLDSNIEKSNGFSVYGEKDILDEKYKTYHQLLYDNNSTKIKIYLKSKKKYIKL